MDFNCSPLWLCVVRVQGNTLAILDQFTLMESATREICWSVRERLQTSPLGVSNHKILQRDATNALRMWILSTSACSACRGPAAGNLVRAHGRGIDTSPMRTNLRTRCFKLTAKPQNQGRFASSLDSEERLRDGPSAGRGTLAHHPGAGAIRVLGRS